MTKLTYRYYTLRTVVPKEVPAADELRKLDERNTDMTSLREDGYDLVSTVTLDQSEGVIVILDTFKRPEM